MKRRFNQVLSVADSAADFTWNIFYDKHTVLICLQYRWRWWSTATDLKLIILAEATMLVLYLHNGYHPLFIPRDVSLDECQICLTLANQVSTVASPRRSCSIMYKLCLVFHVRLGILVSITAMTLSGQWVQSTWLRHSHTKQSNVR